MLRDLWQREHLTTSRESLRDVLEPFDERVARLSSLPCFDLEGLIGIGLARPAWVCNCKSEGGELILRVKSDIVEEGV